jgi:hypothetical protein
MCIAWVYIYICLDMCINNSLTTENLIRYISILKQKVSYCMSFAQYKSPTTRNHIKFLRLISHFIDKNQYSIVKYKENIVTEVLCTKHLLTYEMCIFKGDIIVIFSTHLEYFF